ncbi:MAG TPA: clostripain-related cysteine peptidase [Pyrinomonadaceae bacterium]
MSRQKAIWTVMVYLAGDNNLTSECLFALTEMKKARPGAKINVIAQFDPRDDYLPTRRYHINRNGEESALLDDIIDEARYDRATGEVEFKHESHLAEALAMRRMRTAAQVKDVLAGVADLSTLSFVEEDTSDDTDTGSPSTLYNFLSYCIQEYPAEHYMAVLSGHAGGIETDYLLKDESSKGSLTFNEMKHVFRELHRDLNGRAVDIVGMDNCLMSMSEICYELRDHVDVVVGCESFSPASGWPYRQIVERLRKDFVDEEASKRNSFVAEAAKGIVEEYVNYYSPYWMAGMSVAQSALDLRNVEELRLRLNDLGEAMEGELKREHSLSDSRKPFTDNLVLAHWEAQSYNGERFVDIYDFCSCLEARMPPPTVKHHCKDMRRFISEEFVLKSCYSGAAYQYSYGVSIYFPWATVLEKYENLDFVTESHGRGWLSFLRTYTQLTRREPRGFGAYKARMSSDQMAEDRMSSDRMSSDRMSSDRMSSDRMSSDRMSSDRMSSDRMSSDRMSSDRMSSDRMSSDRMSSDRMMMTEANRVSSMRNPPVVFLPTECKENKERCSKDTFPAQSALEDSKTRQ